jgi:alanine racemase
MALTWIEISQTALRHNISVFRSFLGKTALCVAVKGNAYGHGLATTAPMFDAAGVEFLGVHSIEEAAIIRGLGIQRPIYILGAVELNDIERACELGCSLVVYRHETVEKIASCAKKMNKKMSVHVKVETGNHRQGLHPEEIFSFCKFILAQENLVLEGLTTHFSNIEDTTDDSYARHQIEVFKKVILELNTNAIHIPFLHAANTAGTLLHPASHFTMARVGIGAYGLSPSESTSDLLNTKNIQLRPLLAWKAKIAQIKHIRAGALVGYGCTYKTERPTKLAILPVGYFDGYDRRFSNRAHVMIRGMPAPVRGRVCMNNIMIDVTDIPDISYDDVVTLLGEGISADMLANFAETIHWEIVTRLAQHIPRIAVA